MTTSFAISIALDVYDVRRAMRQMAARAGFSKTAAEELVIVASELATNIIKHAGRGQMSMQAIEVDGRRGVRVEAWDRGPQVHDFATALRDGHDARGLVQPHERGGPKVGLGAIDRLTDAFEYARVGARNRFVACRYL